MAVDVVTEMLRAWSRGEIDADHAGKELHAELKRRARAHLRRERNACTVSPTDLVHDVYLRLAPQQIEWTNRQQFYAMASRMMRRVLVDHARARAARKRGAVRIDWFDAVASVSPPVVDVLAVDQALEALAAEDERQAQLVEMRCFGGLTLEEAADALGVSVPTANRDWKFARAWLARRLGVRTPR